MLYVVSLARNSVSRQTTECLTGQIRCTKSEPNNGTSGIDSSIALTGYLPSAPSAPHSPLNSRGPSHPTPPPPPLVHFAVVGGAEYGKILDGLARIRWGFIAVGLG